MANILTKAEKLAQARSSRKAIVDTPGFEFPAIPEKLRRSNPDLYGYLESQRRVLQELQAHLTSQLMVVRQSVEPTP